MIATCVEYVTVITERFNVQYNTVGLMQEYEEIQMVSDEPAHHYYTYTFNITYDAYKNQAGFEKIKYNVGTELTAFTNFEEYYNMRK